jgi:photosystem II stability/assembly factor-like uncharacterized protein
MSRFSRFLLAVVLTNGFATAFAQAAPAAQTTPASAEAVKVDSDTISGLGARNIGSATMSGRVAAVNAVDEKGRLTVYIGAASGGVWKSVNGGTTFKPIFDKQNVQSIGAIAIDPSNPKTLWVGTGESWMRNSVSVGDGIYKSTDGGDNWTHMGLKDTEHIAKIIVDPKNGNNVYACAPGHLWNDNAERGLYKTSDGGKTWTQILKGSNLSTGCGMISADPTNANTIYASLWDFRRQGWTFRSGGQHNDNGPQPPSGSDFMKSTDGGQTWQALDKTAKGLPAKPWGRVAVAVAPSKPSTVYAFIESEKSALYRSDDSGATWTRLDDSQFMNWRPFYFANLIVDPNNPERLFKVDLNLIMSNDGGKSFSPVSGGLHGDFHDVWINPKNSDHIIVGNDGGAGVSYDGANKWVMFQNLPISQFYHVSVDNAEPYNVYGGLQDNSSWFAPSSSPGGITNAQWWNLYGGDGFWVFPDPTDDDYAYAEYQGGEISRINKKTNESRNIKPLPEYKEAKLHFNWNTPIHVSATDKGTLYVGSQYLFRSRDRGQTWERISPDLSTKDPNKVKQEESGGITVDNSAAEMHESIYSICESPKDHNVVWAGTDDGMLWVTRDAGKNWDNVGKNIQGLGNNPWVSYIDAGKFAAGTAYVTFDRHTFGDMKPYVFKTTDYGKTWTNLVGEGSAMNGYAHVVKEDPANDNILYVGTEHGLWISIDEGKQWAQFKGGDFPGGVAVRDLVIQTRDNDLVIATHGRGIWIIDDITPLRKLSADALNQEAVFINGRPAVQNINGFGGWNSGDGMFEAPNPPDAAVITYYQKKRHIFGDLKIEIFDQQGNLLNSVPGSKRRGLSRTTWSMRLKPPKFPPAASAAFGAAFGPRVLPGTYNVKMTKGKQTYETKLEVVTDPRAKFTPEERKEQFDLTMRLYKLCEKMAYDVDAINGVRDQAKDRMSKLGTDAAAKKQLQALSDKVDAIRGKIVATKEGGAITGEERIRENVGDLYGNVNGYEGKPTAMQVMRTAALERELGDVWSEFDALAKKDLPAVNSALQKKGAQPITVLTEADWQKNAAGKEGAKPGTEQEMELRGFERD